MKIKKVIILIICFLIILLLLCWYRNIIGNTEYSKEEETESMAARHDYLCKEGYEEIEQMIDADVNTVSFQGSILVAKEDEILFAKGYGEADELQEVDNTAKTVYAIGSVSKQFTAAAILKLASEGKLSLSDTLSKYFPDYTAGRGITIMQLLNMQSGIERDFWLVAYRIYGYTTMDQADEFQAAEHSEEELLKLLYQDELLFEPGSQYMYSNVNYYLLSQIVKQVSDVSFQEYITEQLLEPNHMITAGIDFPSTIAIGHYAGERTTENADLYEGCGTICANIYDLYEWNKNLHNGKVLTDASYRVMTTPKEGNYAGGILVEDTLIWHNGQLNGYNSYNCYDTKSGLMLIVLSNSRTYPFHDETADFPAEVIAKMILRQLRDNWNL